MSQNKLKRRSVSYNNTLSKRLSLYETDISQISQNTIIPFVNSRFTLISQQYITKKGEKKVLDSSNELRLSCVVIFNRIKKLVKNITGSHLIKLLKIKLFKQKLQNFVNRKKKQQLKKAFINILGRKDNIKKYQSLLLLNYINKKLIHFQLSYALRKLIIQLSLTEKKLIQTQQNDEMNMSQDKSHNSQKTIKQRVYYSQQKNSEKSINAKGSSPSQLRPDILIKRSNKYSIWNTKSSLLNNIPL